MARPLTAAAAPPRWRLDDGGGNRIVFAELAQAQQWADRHWKAPAALDIAQIGGAGLVYRRRFFAGWRLVGVDEPAPEPWWLR